MAEASMNGGSLGAEAYLVSLRMENTKMEEEIQRLAQSGTKNLAGTAGETAFSPGKKGIRVLSWDPPVVTTAAVDNGSPHRPKVTAERKRDGTFFSS
jgi:hypothetical protein